MIQPTVTGPGYDLYLADCLDILPEMGAGSVDAVVTDPPYGIGIGKMGFVNNRIGGLAERTDYSGQGSWDCIRARDIEKLLRFETVCIWGGNFYSDVLPLSRGWLVWDKKDGGRYSNDFSDCEIAWTNIDMPMRLIRYIWHGMIQNDMANKEIRVHPTQKPVAVMKWCIEILSNEFSTILDPFMGSGTTGVAAIETGRKFVGIERDPGYFEIAVKRIRAAKIPLFVDVPVKQEARQMELV